MMYVSGATKVHVVHTCLGAHLFEAWPGVLVFSLFKAKNKQAIIQNCNEWIGPAERPTIIVQAPHPVLARKCRVPAEVFLLTHSASQCGGTSRSCRKRTASCSFMLLKWSAPPPCIGREVETLTSS